MQYQDMMSFDDLKQQIDLEQFLLSHGYGIRKEKNCRNWRAYTNGNETLFVHDRDNIKLYFKPDGDRGSVIDFCLNRPEFVGKFDGNLKQKVRAFLNQYLNNSDRPVLQENHFIERKPFSVPSTFEYRQNRSGKEFKYLRSRYISDETLNDPIFSNIGTFQSEQGYTNIAFPIYHDGQICGLDLRNYKFKSFAPNSEKSHGLWLSNFSDQINEIIIGESPIDALSYHQLRKQKNTGILYIATCGTLTLMGLNAILAITEAKITVQPELKIRLTFDRDQAGLIFTNQTLMSFLEGKGMYPMMQGKDFRRYVNLKNTDFIDKVKTLPDVTVNRDSNIHFTMIYKNEMDTIHRINEIALKCIDKDITIDLPLSKDFNEDLEIYEVNKAYLQEQSQLQTPKTGGQKIH